jgi:hypothetical protein
MPYTRPGIVSGVTKLTKPFFDNLLDGIDEKVSKNELSVNVRDFGATPSTGTDYTTWADVTSGFQAAIDYAIANKIGKVYVPGGNYLVNGALTVTGPLRIEGSFMGRAKLTGMPADTAGTVISTTGGTAGTFVFTATPPGGGATSTWGLGITDITFYGYGTGSPVDRGAIKLDHVWSELALNNVKVLGFQRQGILSDQSQDGTFKGVSILSCGLHSSGSYAALDLANNTNAFHFFGLHIENSHRLLKLGTAARHNQFVGCKFEQFYAPAAQTWAPILIDNTFENVFSGCHFVQDSANDTFFYTSGTVQPHFIHAQGSTSHTMITNGMFTVPDVLRDAGTALGARWLKIDGSATVQVTSSRFAHAYAGAGEYPFILSDNCVFTDNVVRNYSAGAMRQLIQFGSKNTIADNQIIAVDPSTTITSGVLFAATGTDNVVSPNQITGNYFSLASGSTDQRVVRQSRLWKPDAGDYFFPVSQNDTATSNVLAVGTLRLTPFVVDQTIRIDRLGAEVSTVGEAGSKFRIGVYRDTGGGKPGALVVDAGQIAGDSATAQELTLSSTLVLDPGVYWIGGVVQSVTTTQPTLRTVNFQSSGPQIPIAYGSAIPSAGQVVTALTMTGVTGALPGTFTRDGSGSAVARVFARAA